MERLILVERDASEAGVHGENGALARFAAVRPHGSWRAEVARLAGLNKLTAAGPAEIARHAIVGDAATAGCAACFATPVHVQIGRYGGRLQREGLLRLPRAEIDALIESFEMSPPADLRLRALPDDSVLALTAPVGDVLTVDPEQALDRSIDAVLPAGKGSALLRRLQSELEMWLYALPFNRARAERGEAPISSLWLWGCGARASPASGSPPKDLHIVSRDAYLCGMARLSGATLREHLTIGIEPLLSDGVRRAIMESAGSVPAAVAAVRSGSVRELCVVGRHEVRTLARRDFLKIWRRRRAS